MTLSNRKHKRRVWRERWGASEAAPCYWCGRILSFDEATFDHVPPKSMGNVGPKPSGVIACFGCNHRNGMEVERRKNLRRRDKARKARQLDMLYRSVK